MRGKQTPIHAYLGGHPQVNYQRHRRQLNRGGINTRKEQMMPKILGRRMKSNLNFSIINGFEHLYSFQKTTCRRAQHQQLESNEQPAETAKQAFYLEHNGI
ncbi:hypothetical protein NPIL_663921 [Nephila pilipes]|uniref:Uncharacterized protein n=1 Tax=Nephila pilipes TaxID=299642 RepID=A0A8X6P635_NEPPI|nr:hypothetical protein NPIL_663921 [Nephila pilipes]